MRRSSDGADRRAACLVAAWLFAWVSSAASASADTAPRPLGELRIGGAGPIASHLVRTGDQLALSARGHRFTVPVIPRALRRVVRARREHGTLFIDLPPGAVVQSRAQGRTLVLDISEAAPAGAAVAGAAEDGATPADNAGAGLVPGLPTPFAATIVSGGPAPPPAPHAATDGAGASPVPGNPPREGAAAASRQDARDGMPRAPVALAGPEKTGPTGDHCILLPFPRQTGIAILSRPSSAGIFLDVASRISPETLAEIGPGSAARTDDAAQTTVLDVPLASSQAVRLERSSAGLCFSRSAVGPATARIPMRYDRSSLRFRLDQPGRVLTSIDPASGALLLVGTDRGNAGTLPSTRRSALFTVDRTSAGVVVEPVSDRLVMRAETGGFALQQDDGSDLPVPPDVDTLDDGADGQGEALTRILRVPDESLPLLAARMQQRLHAASLAPARARLLPRLAEAEAMLSLGLGREAAAVLDVASADDPRAGTDARARLLRAVAGLAADRPQSRQQMRRLQAGGTDEEALWHALACSPEEGRPETDAATIRHDMELLLSYPSALRSFAADLAAPVLLASDDPDTIRAVGLLPATADTKVATAVAKARLGDVTSARAALAALARSPDPRLMTEALLAGIKLRTRSGDLAPPAAADLLAAHRLDWRLAGVEPDAILEEADDRLHGGQAKRAFDLWREAAWRGPALHDRIAALVDGGLRALLEPSLAARTTPGDFVSIIENNRDAVASDPVVATSIAPFLADRLEALDLGGRAADILSDIMERMPAGVARASVGTRVAELREDAGAPDAAERALAASDQPDLPPDLLARRRCIRARVLDDRHAPDAALALLGEADDDTALRLKAQLLAGRKDWHGAKLALDVAFRRLPATGSLGRRDGALVLQLAAAALRDGDTRMMSSVVAQADRRLSDPEERASLRLTAAPLAAASLPP